MYCSIFILFLTVVTGIMGFLGLGFGPIETAQVAFYILMVVLVVSCILESPRKKRPFA